MLKYNYKLTNLIIYMYYQNVVLQDATELEQLAADAASGGPGSPGNVPFLQVQPVQEAATGAEQEAGHREGTSTSQPQNSK